MKIIIRTDSSNIIGTGHLMRCLTLAERFRADGASVSFICRGLPGNMTGLISQKGFRLHLLTYESHLQLTSGYASWLGVRWYTDAEETAAILASESPDLLIVDHYALDARWEERQRPFAGKIMVIDDLANRHHDCDILLDQNYHADPSRRYEMLLPESCTALFGPQYAPLRPEFARVRKDIRIKEDPIRKLFLFFGGVDPENETAKALEAIERLGNNELTVDIVIGSGNRHRDEISATAHSIHGATLHCQIDNMAEMMAEADLAIGAGGTTAWERCCLGLPSLIIAVAENQVPISESCHEAGIGIYLGKSEQVTSNKIGEALQSLLEQPSLINEMRRKELELCDGLGADRVFQNIHKLSQIKVSV